MDGHVNVEMIRIMLDKYDTLLCHTKQISICIRFTNKLNPLFHAITSFE